MTAKTDWKLISELCTLAQEELPGWMVSLHERAATMDNRAALISPDYRVQIGRDGQTLEAALGKALLAAKSGERQ